MVSFYQKNAYKFYQHKYYFYLSNFMYSVTKDRLEKIYQDYSKKQNGMIKTQEINKIIRSAQLFPSEQETIQLQKLIDPNRKGYFGKSKFVEIALQFIQKQNKANHQQDLVKAFSFFDANGDGCITDNDLKKMMIAFGHPLNQQQFREIMKQAKVMNGKINYIEFAKTLSQCNASNKEQ